MQSVWFFPVIFCGIFGAAELLRLLYAAVIGAVLKLRGKRGKGGSGYRGR